MMNYEEMKNWYAKVEREIKMTKRVIKRLKKVICKLFAVND